MALKQIDHGTPEYEKMIRLREEVLRHPLGLSFSEDELNGEKNDVLIAAFDDDEMLGCCLLTEIKEDIVRLRQMAVRDNVQRKGIGQAIMNFAETLAKDKGYKKIIMHARDTAMGFYERCGYTTVSSSFIEVSIPHYLMEKTLT